MSEVDFLTASFEAILRPYFTYGCVLLRNSANLNNLTTLIKAVDALYTEIDDIHIYPRDLQRRGLLQFHEYIFGEKHYNLSNNIFITKYSVSEDTATRRIDNVTPSAQWMAPCGVEGPGLAVVRAPFREIMSFPGYDGSPEANGPAGEWNLPRFNGSMRTLVSNTNSGAIEQLRTLFGDRVWSPTHSLGDAMMLSNWTLHFTHASPGMTQRRGAVELRFLSYLTLAEMISEHGGDGMGIVCGTRLVHIS